MYIKFTSLICMIFLNIKNVYSSDTIDSKPIPLVHTNISFAQNFLLFKADAVNIQFFINDSPLHSPSSLNFPDDNINEKEYLKEENVGNFANYFQNDANSKIFFEKLGETTKDFLSLVEKSYINFENPSKKNDDIEENNSKTKKNNINGDLNENSKSMIV